MKQLIGSNWFFHPSYSRKTQDRLTLLLTKTAFAWMEAARKRTSQEFEADLSKLAVGFSAGATGVYQDGHEVWMLTHAAFECGDGLPSHVMIGIGPRDCIEEQAAKFQTLLARARRASGKPE